MRTVILFSFAAFLTLSYSSLSEASSGDNLCTVLCSDASKQKVDRQNKMTLHEHLSRSLAEADFIKENVRNNSVELSQIRMLINELVQRQQQNSTVLPKSEQEIQRPENMLEKGVPEIVTSANYAVRTIPSDCEVMRQNLGRYYIGRYYTQINPSSDGSKPAFLAGCELRDDTGWTIIQKRIDGSLSFDRSWDEYKNGFGHIESEFWIGNDKIHRLTNNKQNTYRLRIELQTGSGRKFYAEYSNFRVADEADNYRLTVSGYVGGSAGDALTGILSHNGSLFTTRDRDNDKYESGNCAVQYHGGWWFHSCFVAFLNGIVPSSQPVQNANNGNSQTTRDFANWHSRKVRSFYVPAMVQDGIVWRTINKRQTRDSAYYDDIIIKTAMMMVAPGLS